MQMLPYTCSCFVCGCDNPLGLKLRFETDGRIVTAKFSFQSEHAGFKQTIHGGLIATVLDETMVWACAIQAKRFAFCAELNLRYLQPARPQTPVTSVGELVANRRDKLFVTTGELRDVQGTVLARAEGKYLSISEKVAVDEMADFVGDLSFLGKEYKTNTQRPS